MINTHAVQRRRLIPWALVASLALVTVAVAQGDRSSEPGAADTTVDSTEGPSSEGGTPGAEAETGTTSQPVSSEDHPESYLDFAFAGGYLMIPIGLFSILWLSFFAERLSSTRRAVVLPGAFTVAVENLSPGQGAQVESLCAAHPSSAARVIRTAYDRLDLERDEIEAAVNSSAQRELHRVRRFLQLFAVLAAVAPLIGLLGTVTGMIQAFREVAIQGLGSGQALAPGIYKALVTTAAGLIVAIPSLITYHWLAARVATYTHELDLLVTDFVDTQRRGQVARAES